jgi:hypothetical protein
LREYASLIHTTSNAKEKTLAAVFPRPLSLGTRRRVGQQEGDEGEQQDVR